MAKRSSQRPFLPVLMSFAAVLQSHPHFIRLAFGDPPSSVGGVLLNSFTLSTHRIRQLTYRRTNLTYYGF